MKLKTLRERKRNNRKHIGAHIVSTMRSSKKSSGSVPRDAHDLQLIKDTSLLSSQQSFDQKNKRRFSTGRGGSMTKAALDFGEHQAPILLPIGEESTESLRLPG